MPPIRSWLWQVDLLVDGVLIQFCRQRRRFCCLPSPKEALSMPAIHRFQTCRHRFVRDLIRQTPLCVANDMLNSAFSDSVVFQSMLALWHPGPHENASASRGCAPRSARHGECRRALSKSRHGHIRETVQQSAPRKVPAEFSATPFTMWGKHFDKVLRGFLCRTSCQRTKRNGCSPRHPSRRLRNRFSKRWSRRTQAM